MKRYRRLKPLRKLSRKKRKAYNATCHIYRSVFFRMAKAWQNYERSAYESCRQMLKLMKVPEGQAESNEWSWFGENKNAEK